MILNRKETNVNTIENFQHDFLKQLKRIYTNYNTVIKITVMPNRSTGESIQQDELENIQELANEIIGDNDFGKIENGLYLFKNRIAGGIAVIMYLGVKTKSKNKVLTRTKSNLIRDLINENLEKITRNVSGVFVKITNCTRSIESQYQELLFEYTKEMAALYEKEYRLKEIATIYSKNPITQEKKSKKEVKKGR